MSQHNNHFVISQDSASWAGLSWRILPVLLMVTCVTITKWLQLGCWDNCISLSPCGLSNCLMVLTWWLQAPKNRKAEASSLS